MTREGGRKINGLCQAALRLPGKAALAAAAAKRTFSVRLRGGGKRRQETCSYASAQAKAFIGWHAVCGLDDTAVLLCAFTEITQTAASTKNAFYSTPEGSVSPYGSRYGGENFYTGVDMAMDNAYGKSVLAAQIDVSTGKIPTVWSYPAQNS